MVVKRTRSVGFLLTLVIGSLIVILLSVFAVTAKGAYDHARAKLIADGYEPLPWRNGKLESCQRGATDRSCMFAFERKSDNTQKAIQTLGVGALNSRRARIIEEGYLAIRYNQPPSGLGTYPQARARLMAQGYQPLKFFHGRDDYFCDGICDRYPELEDCSGTGLNYCWFTFFRPSDGRYRQIVTTGEGPIARRDADSIDTPSPEMIERFKEKMLPRYATVRAQMAGQGYKPVKLKEGPTYWECPDRICEHYPEVLTCQDTLDKPCQFVFYRASDRAYRVVNLKRLDFDAKRRVWDLPVTGSAQPTPAQLKGIAARR